MVLGTELGPEYRRTLQNQELYNRVMKMNNLHILETDPKKPSYIGHWESETPDQSKSI